MATSAVPAINLDRADKEQLKSLREVGDARSERIIAARNRLGALTRAFLFDWEDFPPNFWRYKFEKGEVTNDEQLEESFGVYEDPHGINDPHVGDEDSDVDDPVDNDLQNNLNVPAEVKAPKAVGGDVASSPGSSSNKLEAILGHLVTAIDLLHHSVREEGKANRDSLWKLDQSINRSIGQLGESIRGEGEITRKAIHANATISRAELRFTENNCMEGNLASQRPVVRPKDRPQDFALPPPLKTEPDVGKRGPPVTQKLMDTITARQAQGPPAPWASGTARKNALHQEAPPSPPPRAPRHQHPEGPSERNALHQEAPYSPPPRAPRPQQPEAPALAMHRPQHHPGVPPRHPKPKLPTFTGKPGDALDWTAFIVQFERISQRQDWDDEAKLDRLIECLQDRAAHFFSRLPLAHRNQYRPLCDRLKLRFAPVEPLAVLRKRLQDAKQGLEESLPEFASRVQQIALDAHPNLALDAIELMAVDAFLSGCKEKLAALNSLNRDPQTMEQALTQVMAAVANQHAVFGPTPVSKLRQVIRFEEPSESSYEVRAVQTLSERSAVPERKQQSRVETLSERSAVPEKKLEKDVALLRADVSTLCVEMREMIAALRGALPQGEPSPQRGRQFRSRSPSPLPRESNLCFNCNAAGHYSRDCPLRDAGRQRPRSPSPASGKGPGL